METQNIINLLNDSSNEESKFGTKKLMNDIMKIVQALEDSNILLKGINKTIENKTKEQKGGFLRMLLGTLGASLLVNMLTGKGILRAGYGNKKGKGISRAGYGSKKNFIPLHPLTNIEIQQYYQKESRLNEVYSRGNLPKKLKDRNAYVINLDQYADVGTHWIALYALNNDITYFDSLGVEHIPKEIEKFIGNKNIKTNILRTHADTSSMCGNFSIRFIDFMLTGKTLIDYTSLFSSYESCFNNG